MLSDKRIAPNLIILEEFEQRRIVRSLLALELGKTPAEIDALPTTDIGDLIAVYNHRKAMESKQLGLNLKGQKQ